MNNIKLTLDNPTEILEFILSKHRDSFFSFLVNGNRVKLTKPLIKNAIDLYFDLREMDGIPRATSQFEVNTTTNGGIQNLYAIMFFCDALEVSK